MEPLKIKRKGLTISFRTCVNKIETELNKSNPDLKFIDGLQMQLKDKFNRLEDIQKKIGDNFLQMESTEKEYEENFIAAEEYRDRYLYI